MKKQRRSKDMSKQVGMGTAAASPYALFEFLSDDKGFESLFHNSSIAKALSNVNTRQFIAVNKAWETYTGYQNKEVVGKSAYELNLVDEKEGKYIREILGKNYSLKSYEADLIHKNGDRTNTLYFFDQITIGENDFILSEILDISALKKSNDLLRIEKEFSQELLLSIREGIIVVNLEGVALSVNPAFCHITGFTEAELVGIKSPYPYWPPESYHIIEDALKASIEGDKRDFEFNLMRKNGERFLTSISTAHVKDREGNLIAILGTIQDISEQRAAQNLLEETAEKAILRKKAILELASFVGEEFDQSIKKITAIVAKTLNVERVGLWKFNKDSNHIVCDNLFYKSKNSYEDGMVIKKELNPVYFEALEKFKTINVTDAVKNEITKGFAEKYFKPNNISSLLDVFIRGRDEFYGIICIEHVGPLRVWLAEEEEFARSIGHLVSLMVESTERRVAEHQLSLLNDKLSTTVLELNSLKDQLQNENIYLKDELDLVFNFEEMVYGSAAFSEVLSNVEKVAPTDATVLLLGDTGTGKELLARAVHNISERKDKPLIKVNCAAIPRELIESELFGHKKGSFTGAVADKMGKVELAHDGTLFLDEIGELPLSMQPKLLRFLQEGEIEKIGENTTRKLDVRIIAATNRNLKKEVAKKRFREDLYFRLNVFPIKVPPLCKRQEDIPLLIEHFVNKFGKIYRKEIKYISDAAMSEMQQYKWPGNIRELENLIERAVILSHNEYLQLPDFEISKHTNNRTITNTNLSLDEIQYNHIIKVLDNCNWKIDGDKGAAILLKMKPSTLRDRMKKLKIKRPD